MDIADLRWLRHSAPVMEPLPSVIGDSVDCVVSQAAEHKEAGDGRPSSALARITIDNHYVVFFLLQERVHFLAHFEQHIHCRRVVVLPLILFDHVLELFVVVLSA